MTLIQVNPLASDLGFPGWSKEDVIISVTPWSGRTAAVRIEDGVNLILPDTDTLQVINGVFSKPLDLEPTSPSWCWRIVIEARRLKVTVTRYVLVPTVPENESIPWSDLIDVDPASLVIIDNPSMPAWMAELEILRERVRVVEELGGGDTAQALQAHIISDTPHTALENIPDLAELVSAGLSVIDLSDPELDQDIPDLVALVQNGLS